ncbi:beta-microseminoprotein A1-like [Patagioenas fasciata monilis]|uniref:Beta-microseminoprotein A1-like n=1 Tax=Patagioenas fasciata monilis TaxID=372326 RepID=A0A1V4KIW6_PATFA|nr:beta-microseminoprotein A1-like [Patagioenas fasciata monilis]
MKTILACLLVLAISVTLSNAVCFYEPLNPGISRGELTGCLDSNGELHEFDTHWTNTDCYYCSCTSSGINCCSTFVRPVGYDEEKCVSIFNKETCTYKVVEKEDHSKECPVYAAKCAAIAVIFSISNRYTQIFYEQTEERKNFLD